MIDHNPHLMLTVLKRDYPEIASIISERIKKTLPEEILTDFNWIAKIVMSFKKEKDLNIASWQNLPGHNKITEHREMLIAVILLFFHPERILSLTKGNTRQGLVKCISLNLKCDPVIISQSINNSISVFKSYKAFNEEVYRLYELIKLEHKIFIN